jgi:hypothetical protein
MRTERRPAIRKGRFYVLATVPGISGFQRWDEREYRIVTADKARNHRLDVVGELLPIQEDWFRLEDGHMPDYQPKARLPKALEWLTANPFQAIVRLDPATATKDTPPHFQPL